VLGKKQGSPHGFPDPSTVTHLDRRVIIPTRSSSATAAQGTDLRGSAGRSPAPPAGDRPRSPRGSATRRHSQRADGHDHAHAANDRGDLRDGPILADLKRGSLVPVTSPLFFTGTAVAVWRSNVRAQEEIPQAEPKLRYLADRRRLFGSSPSESSTVAPW